jgi:hypothetical protein
MTYFESISGVSTFCPNGAGLTTVCRSIEDAKAILSVRFDFMNLTALFEGNDITVTENAPLPGARIYPQEFYSLSVMTDMIGQKIFGEINMVRSDANMILRIDKFYPKLIRTEGLGGAVLSLILLRGNRHAGYHMVIRHTKTEVINMVKRMKPFIQTTLPSFPDAEVCIKIPKLTDIELQAVEWIFRHYLSPRRQLLASPQLGPEPE